MTSDKDGPIIEQARWLFHQLFVAYITTVLTAKRTSFTQGEPRKGQASNYG